MVFTLKANRPNLAPISMQTLPHGKFAVLYVQLHSPLVVFTSISVRESSRDLNDLQKWPIPSNNQNKECN